MVKRNQIKATKRRLRSTKIRTTTKTKTKVYLRQNEIRQQQLKLQTKCDKMKQIKYRHCSAAA